MSVTFLIKHLMFLYEKRTISDKKISKLCYGQDFENGERSQYCHQSLEEWGING